MIMQSLWSRAAQSQSSCRCVCFLSTAVNGVSSQAAATASCRRLRIGNSVTVLYSSIFAAAALADAKAKNERRLELENRIAAVKEEVKELVEEEHRLLAALAFRRTELNPSRSVQTRRFSTVPAFRSVSSSPNPCLLTKTVNHNVSQEPESSHFKFENPLTEYSADADGETGLFTATDSHAWASGDLLRIKAIQKLAIKQLAIRFLLRPVIAHNYSGIPMDYAADFSVPQLSIAELMKELSMARRRIRALKASDKEAYDDLARDIGIRQYHDIRVTCESLDAALRDDINLYLNMKMSLPELLLRVSNNLISSDEPDRPKTFQLMITAFTKTRQNDLVDLILRTILPHRFELTTPLIISTLAFYRKSKNLKDFDQFLQMLRGEGYPVNLRSTTLYRKELVNGMEITVPPRASSNPLIYGALISAALRFDQVDRADAWLQAWRETGFLDDFSTLCAYLRFYGLRRDWENGLLVLARALVFITTSSRHSEGRVERLIVHMVHFCDSCRQKDVSIALINTAVRAGFDWRAAYKQSDIYSEFEPSFHLWREAAEASNSTLQQRTNGEKCYTFAILIGDRIRQLIEFGEKDFSGLRRSMSNGHLRDLLSAALLGGRQTNSKGLPHAAGYPTSTLSASHEIISLDTTKIAAVQNPNDGHVALSAGSADLLVLKDEISRLKKIVAQLRQADTQIFDLHNDSNAELSSSRLLSGSQCHSISQTVQSRNITPEVMMGRPTKGSGYTALENSATPVLRYRGRKDTLKRIKVRFLGAYRSGERHLPSDPRSYSLTEVNPKWKEKECPT